MTQPAKQRTASGAAKGNSAASARRSKTVGEIMSADLLTVETGILVIAVEPHSPAQRAGLHEGDVIIGLAEHAVAGIDDLHRLLTDKHIGRRISLSILRGATKMAVDIVPEESQPLRPSR